MKRHSCCKKGLCSLERATGHWTSRQTASFSLPKDDWVKSAVAIDADLLTLLRCISCGGTFTTADASAGDYQLWLQHIRCIECGKRVPVDNGIPRFVSEPDSKVAQRTQHSFGYEWTKFSDWKPSGDSNFKDYFDRLDLDALATQRTLDAGCGMGRHAKQLAPYVGQLVALDFSVAIDQAAQNLSLCRNTDCIQADLTHLPFADESFDFIYSMGVLHHLTDTLEALRHLVSKVRVGGRIRFYLYWKRKGISGFLLTAVNLLRAITTRLPLPLLSAVSFVIASGLFCIVVLPYRIVESAGVNLSQTLPLVTYVKYPFRVLWNDQFDRFSAPIEKRYSESEVHQLLVAAGLEEVTVFSKHGWIADGQRPG